MMLSGKTFLLCLLSTACAVVASKSNATGSETGSAEAEGLSPTNNQYFLTTLYLLLVGGFTTGIYYAIVEIIDLFTRMFIIHVSLDNRHEAFEWVVRWLANVEQKNNSKTSFFSSQRLTVSVKKNKKNDDRSRIDDDIDPEVEFLPGPGSHILRYRGKLIWLSRNADSKVTTVGWNRKPFVSEHLHMSTYGRDYRIFEQFFKEARKGCIEKDTDKTKVYILDEYSYGWELATSKPPRDFESVILDDNLASEIYSDAKEFLESSDYYIKMGLPYRRGYLLYGPPGCGKTSFVTALAARLRLNICVLTLSGNSLDDQKLNSRLHEAPSQSIILLEDIDAVFIDRTQADDHSSRVTFSGLLNALDGVASQEGKIFLMTTNHIEKLDPALLRPGRCDVKCLFKLASKNQLHKMFVRFYPEHEQLAEEFTNVIPEYTVAMAAVQEHLMRYTNNPQGAIENYQELLDENSKHKKISSELGQKPKEKIVNLKYDEIGTWLTRLGLSEYTKCFHDQRLFRIRDLKNFDSSAFEEIGVTKLGDCERITGMLSGREDIKADFEFATPKAIRSILLSEYLLPSENERSMDKYLDTFLSKLEGVEVTLAQIKLHTVKFDSREKALENIDLLINPPKNLQLDAKSIYDEEETISSFMKRNKLSLLSEQQLKTLEEQEVSLMREFIQLEEDDFETLLEIKHKGLLLKLTKLIEKVKKFKEKADKMNKKLSGAQDEDDD